MVEQLSFWPKSSPESFNDISKPSIVEEKNKLEISFIVTKADGDKIKISFVFNLDEGENQKPQVIKKILFSNKRAFINETSREVIATIDKKYYEILKRQAYAIFNDRLKNRKSIQNIKKEDQPELPFNS